MANAVRDFVFPSIDVDHADEPWPLIRAGVIGTILLVAGIAFWTWLAPLSAAVMGTGHVKVDTNRKTVQHQEGGIVGEILVRDGSRVEAGQTLIVLKDVRVDSTNEAVRAQLDAELATASRLAVEQTGARTISFSPELMDRRAIPNVAELMQQEAALFRTRQQALVNQLELIRNQARETRAEIKARTGQLKSDAAAIEYQRDELAQNLELAKQGFVSKTRLLTLQRAAAEYESRRAENEAELARAHQKVSELELRAETLRSNYQQQATGELRQTTAVIAELRERLRASQDAEQRQRIVAPIAGEVVDLKVTTIGAVIAPRDPVMDIVPDNPVLVVEARLRPEDISFVSHGAPADVRLTAFRQRMTPTVEGEVTYISADRLTDKSTGTPYYVAHVLVSSEALHKAGNLRLQAGMPAEVYIKTTPRNALQYMLDPIFGFLQRSLREH